MSSRVTVYVTIGNSDDKLSQQQWSQFHRDVDRVIRKWGHVIHGQWVSESTSAYQNACWCFEGLLSEFVRREMTADLRSLAVQYNQDSIAWAEVRDVTFLGPVVE